MWCNQSINCHNACTSRRYMYVLYTIVAVCTTVLASVQPTNRLILLLVANRPLSVRIEASDCEIGHKSQCSYDCKDHVVPENTVGSLKAVFMRWIPVEDQCSSSTEQAEDEIEETNEKTFHILWRLGVNELKCCRERIVMQQASLQASCTTNPSTPIHHCCDELEPLNNCSIHYRYFFPLIIEPGGTRRTMAM